MTLTKYVVRQGFGKGRVKEYFVVEQELGALRGYVAGPFGSEQQAGNALDALRPLYAGRTLSIIGGHLAQHDSR